MLKTKNLFQKNLPGAEIKVIKFDKYNFYIEFNSKMKLTIYSKFEIIGLGNSDFSDLVGMKISKYKEEKDYYLIQIGRDIYIRISIKEEDYNPEIMQLVLSDGTIIIDRGENN